MRLFLAVDLDEPLQRAAGTVADRLRRDIERGGRPLAPAGASWVAASNLHVTLRFLGEVAEPALAPLAQVVSQPFAQAPFTLELSGLGMFPAAGRPRVAWIGIGRGAAELSALHAELEGRLAPLGFPSEGRPFRAHLTIARFREPAAPTVRDLVTRTSGSIGACRVASVVLYQSRLGPAGARYTALARARLEDSP